jgi:ubiquinone biosynthesis monooxygenase Coq7
MTPSNLGQFLNLAMRSTNSLCRFPSRLQLFQSTTSHVSFFSTSSTSESPSSTPTTTRSSLHLYSPEKIRRKELIDSMIRVNHAGEFGAKRIYQGQLDALRGQAVEPLIQKMADQEKIHLQYFEKVIPEYRVRPTVLHPIWNILGYSLGYITGKMGTEAAMACTEAVETVIGEHYNEQLRTLGDENLLEEEKNLKENIRRFRDEELEHLDIAVENDSKKAVAYQPLVHFVEFTTRTAIWLSKRI